MMTEEFDIQICNYCREKFNADKRYGIYNKKRNHKPLYCTEWCKNRAMTLRNLGLNHFKKVTQTDKLYLQLHHANNGHN